jgi:hypothetical protein
MTDVNIGALAQAVPDQVPSFGNGQASILLVSVPDLKNGGTRVSVLHRRSADPARARTKMASMTWT